MKPVSRLILVLLGLTALSGCSWFGDKDNAEPPAELQSFDAQVRLKKLWGHDTGDGTDEQLVKLVPTVQDERVYVADRGGAVRAYTLDKGKQVWSVKTDSALSAGPGVGGGLVVVGSSNADLIALDAQSGEQRWKTSVSSEVLAVPQIYRDVVVVQTVDGNLAGLDAETGEQRWIQGRSVPVLTLRGTSTPLIEGNAIIAGFANGKIVALDALSGRPLWEAVVAVPSGRSELQRMVDVDASAVIRDGVLYVTSFQGQMAAVGLRDGRLLWNRDMSAYAGIAVDSQQVYVSDEESDVWALDRGSGASLWKQDDLRRRSLTGPAIVGDYVAVGDFEGYVHLLSRLDGSIVGRAKIDRAGVTATPVALGERLLVLGAGGKLALYKLDPIRRE
jgi:outer membrane protein assembly factor BamB